MPRLIDDLRGNPKLAAPWFILPQFQGEWTAHAGRIMEWIRNPEIPVLHIDNVAQYYFTGTDQENWNIGRDFPNLAPPFPIFWIEHKLCTRMHSKEKGDSDLSHLGIGKGRVGVLFIAAPVEDVVGTNIPPNTRWILVAEIFIDYGQHDRVVQGPHGTITMAIDAEGAAIDTPYMQTWSDPQHNDLLRSLMTWLHPAFLAISFMHCHNVVQQEERTPKPLAKKFHEKTGVWPTRYHTLVIEPLKQVLRSQGRSHEVGLAKALHICRGHFRDYRQGAGLFGKYKKLVWSPMTMRGTGKQPPPREIEVKV